MTTFKEKYVVNEKGEKVSVLLDLKDYQKILEELEELESIRAYDLAKASGEKPLPFQEAVEEIEKEKQ